MAVGRGTFNRLMNLLQYEVKKRFCNLVLIKKECEKRKSRTLRYGLNSL